VWLQQVWEPRYAHTRMKLPWLRSVYKHWDDATWDRYSYFELAVLVSLPWLVCVLMSFLFASTYHSMPLTVWVIALTLLTVCIWHARHDAQHGVQEWHTVLPLSCMAGVVVSSCLGLVAYKSFYSHYWLYRSSHSYVNVLPSEPAAGYLDAGKLVFADEARVDAKRGLGFKDRSVYCVAPIIDDSKPEKIQFWAAGQDCCSARGDFECDDAWDRKAHAGVVVRRAAPEYLQAVKQAKAVYGLSSPAEPIFVQWVVDPEKVELNYWLLGNGVLIGSCLVFLVLSGVVNVILLPLTKPPEEVRQPMVRPPRQACC